MVNAHLFNDNNMFSLKDHFMKLL